MAEPVTIEPGDELKLEIRLGVQVTPLGALRLDLNLRVPIMKDEIERTIEIPPEASREIGLSILAATAPKGAPSPTPQALSPADSRDVALAILRAQGADEELLRAVVRKLPALSPKPKPSGAPS